MRNKAIFYLNGKRHETNGEESSMMLADYLRYEKCLTGTKIVCSEGDCGACSVLRFFPETQDYYLPVNSCITPVAILDGSSLVTVDALKSDDNFHEVQRAMIECHGSQCGFCTPGFVVALGGLVDEKISKKEKDIKKQEAKNALTGNLCRCTGYESILDAAVDIDLKKEKSLRERFCDKEQLNNLKEVFEKELFIEEQSFSFYAPKNIEDACKYLNDHSDTKIMASATDLGVVVNKRKAKYTRILSLHLISELYEVSIKGNRVKVGARCTITDLRKALKGSVEELSNYLDIFASPQIKNIATLVGNIANASPIGDTAPTLLTLNTKVHLSSTSTSREIDLDNFFLDYRKTALKPGEIITHLEFEIPGNNSDYRFTKNSNRKDLDISAVNFAIKVDWKNEEKKMIKDIAIAAGGVAAIPLKLSKTEDILRGKKIDSSLIDSAINVLQSEFNPLSDVRSSDSYRRIVIENYFRRFFSDLGII